MLSTRKLGVLWGLAVAGAVGLVVSLTLLVTQSGAAPVGPINPVAPTSGFLVMTEGDAKVESTENEGTMAVGGDLSFGNYQLATNSAGSYVVPGDTNPTALVVGGRIDFADSVPGTRLQVLQSGYVKIGDLTGALVRDTDNNNAQANTRVLPSDDYETFPRVELVTRQPVDSVGPTSPLDFRAAFTTFRSNSTALATCLNTLILRDPNGEVLPRPIPPGSNAVINLSPDQTNVLNIGAVDLANISVLTFADPPTPQTSLLVNVDTTDVADDFIWHVPNFAGIGGEQARYIMFNFPTAQSLTLGPNGATLEGAIYAPNADLIDIDPSNTEGSIVARTYQHQGGEVHDYPFSTTLTCENAGPTESPTQPTVSPTGSPTSSPTISPTGSPTVSPTVTPTRSPRPSPTCPTGSPHRSDPKDGPGSEERWDYDDPTCPAWSASPQPPLPVTGSSTGSLLATGGALVSAGLLLLVLLMVGTGARRRTG